VSVIGASAGEGKRALVPTRLLVPDEESYPTYQRFIVKPAPKCNMAI
jgi:hypothetical protein